MTTVSNVDDDNNDYDGGVLLLNMMASNRIRTYHKLKFQFTNVYHPFDY